MIKNYFKIAWRNLLKNKAYSLINILGLAMGMTICIFVFLLVHEEVTFDRWLDGSEDIYRVNGVFVNSGEEELYNTTPAPLAMTMAQELPEVKYATRVMNWGSENSLYAYGSRKFYVENTYYIDSSFFKIFSLELDKGDINTVAEKPKNVILSKALAKNIFGNQNPIGEILRYDNREDVTVAGVMGDNPETHLKSDIYFVSSSADIQHKSWMGEFNYATYCKLYEGTDAMTFEKKLKNMYRKYAISQGGNIAINDITAAMMDTTDLGMSVALQSFNDIHLYSQLEEDLPSNSDVNELYIYGLVALIILLIACINFMNLATARSAKRAKEVGVRKVLGSSRSMLFWQFLVEAIIQSFIAVFIALVLTELALPIFNNILDKDLNLYSNNLPTMLGVLGLMAIFSGILSGLYPAIFLSGFRPVEVLKGNFAKSKESAFFRKGLVVFQFTLCTVFILFLMTVVKQIDFINNKNLGFYPDQVLVVPIQTKALRENTDALKKTLKDHPNIEVVSKAHRVPGNRMGGNYIKIGEVDELIDYTQADEDYLEALGIELVEGRTLQPADFKDTLIKIVVNEAFVRKYQLEYPVASKIAQYNGVDCEIVGVMKDFHNASFDKSIQPFVLIDRTWMTKIVIKMNTQNPSETIAFIEEKWAEFEPTHPMQYTFLDKEFGKIFESQNQFSKALTYITFLILLTALLGLFSLASYMAEQRTKEIGIRKVLGASNMEMMNMLIKDFVKLVLIASIIALPAAYLLSKQWLVGFAYQTDIELLPYILAIVVTLLIALLTVLVQSFRASIAEPVVALKYE